MYFLLLFFPLVFIVFIFFSEVPFIKKIINYNRLDRAFMLCFNSEDDSDIKISGSTEIQHEDYNILEVSDMQKQKENGNLNKARELGELLFTQIIKNDDEANFGLDIAESKDTQLQRRILLAFTVIFCADKYIKNQIVNKAIENSFFNIFRANQFELYTNLEASGAFSFYYLCVRRNEKIEQDIGHVFAMLCGKENDQIMQELGTALFLHYSDVIKKTIKSIKFLYI
jgi:hypothetical protein